MNAITSPTVSPWSWLSDPKMTATRNGRQTVAGIIRRITKKNQRAAFRADASAGGSVCHRCHSWFATYQARNTHRRMECAK